MNYPDNWDGDDEKVLVEGIPILTFVDQMEENKHEVFRDYTFLITRMFDARVKSFIPNILMGPGKDKIKLTHYSYRVEFQARGMLIFIFAS